MENPNGKNEISISIPCCDEDEMLIQYKTKSNEKAYEIFQAMSKWIGLEISVKNLTAKKGGGD